MNLSGIILAKDNEKIIKDCIQSLDFCDEIIVIDDYSKDKTAKISKSLGARVFKHNLDRDFAAQRNFGLKKAKGNWVLFIDPDERVTKALKKEIIQSIKVPQNCSGLYLKREYFLWGKKIKFGEVGSTKLLRLAKKNFGRWTRRVHEVWRVSGKIGQLINPLEHRPSDSLEKFADRINTWSSIHAEENYKEGKRSSLIKIIFWPIAKFCQNYFLRLGFLDGFPGLIIATLMSYHSFLAWSKLWIHQAKIK